MSWRLPQNPGLDGLSAELTLAEVLTVQNISGLGDPNADRILFWDDSAGAYAFLTVGSGLSITDTTITATAGSGATAALDNLAAVAINAALLPGTSDSIALGSATKMWSDLFLGDGAVINFNNGDVTITHSSNAITVDGGNLALGSNSLTITGSIASTLSRVTKGWFTDIESTNMPTVGGTSLSSTFAPIASPTFTGTVTVPASNFTVGASIPFSDSAGTLTLQNVDAIDATTESTIEAAIDTLANLSSIAGTSGTVAFNGANITDLGDVTFKTGAQGGVLRTGTSNADKFVLQAYDVNDTTYRTVIELDAGNTVVLQLRANFLEIDDNTDTTKRVTWSVSGATASTATTLTFAQTAARTITFPDATDTLVGKATTDTLTNKTLTAPAIGGAAQLAENASIRLDQTLSADGTYSGLTIAGTAGAALAFGDLIYLAAADSRWELADADAAATAGDVILGMCVLAAAADGDPTVILLQGNIRADAAFPTLTIGAQAYVSTTPGDIQVAQPSGTDDVIRVVGFALTADSLYFNPSPDYITKT